MRKFPDCLPLNIVRTCLDFAISSRYHTPLADPWPTVYYSWIKNIKIKTDINRRNILSLYFYFSFYNATRKPFLIILLKFRSLDGFFCFADTNRSRNRHWGFYLFWRMSHRRRVRSTHEHVRVDREALSASIVIGRI